MFFCLGTGSKETDIACIDSTFIWKWSEVNYYQIIISMMYQLHR